MELLPLVRGLRLGSDVAEQDSHLSRYFVRNASYFDLVDDEVDVILGPKGSGKSAISRILVDPAAERPPQLEDVDLVAAFNLHGSSIFRRLSAEIGDADEGLLRTAWTIYVLALIGNHLVDNYWNGYIEDVLARLESLGLRYSLDRPKTVWSSVLNFIRRLKPAKVEVSLTAVGISGTAAAEFGLDELKDREPIDWESLLTLEVQALQSVGRRCWLVFDRLDEAFPNDRQLEKVALRALLQTHRDVCSYGSIIKTKLFLRTDLIDRITRDEGFVNATHLRLHHIVWDREAIADFVARRLLGSAEVAKAVNVDETYLATPEGRSYGFDLLIPPNVGGQNAAGDSHGWLTAYTSDATKQPNPRNILTLLREARSRQMQICQRDGTEYHAGDPLLSRSAVRAAVNAMSVKRVQDTLFAEFEDLRPWLDQMEGRPFTYTPQQFANTMNYADATLPEVVWAIEQLKYAGVFSQAPNGQLTVPILYRSGLRLQDRGNPGQGGRRRGSG